LPKYEHRYQARDRKVLQVKQDLPVALPLSTSSARIDPPNFAERFDG